jgi:transcriptional regulator with XRE-family HTH domain
LRTKDYSEVPQTLGQHLKRRRRELDLLQREAAERMGIGKETYANWEKDKTTPVASQFRPVVTFLGYDPSSPPATLKERVVAKRRALGVTFDQVANHLGWDSGTLTRYLNSTWSIPAARAVVLDAFLGAPASDLRSIHQLPRRR